jgi:hypothetical protein
MEEQEIHNRAVNIIFYSGMFLPGGFAMVVTSRALEVRTGSL